MSFETDFKTNANKKWATQYIGRSIKSFTKITLKYFDPILKTVFCMKCFKSLIVCFCVIIKKTEIEYYHTSNFNFSIIQL